MSAQMHTIDGDRIRVLFLHPAYPSQFTRTAEALNRDPRFEVWAAIEQSLLSQAHADGCTVSYIGFSPDGAPTAYSYPFVNAIEAGIRNARGLAYALTPLSQSTRFDVVVGHAAFGMTLYARALLGCAVVSYAELPGYHAQAARPEFPFLLDQLLSSGTCEALTYTSMLNSDHCVVPSEHARRLFPAELQPKITVQMEGFEVPAATPSKEDARISIGVDPRVPLVGFFGRTLEGVRGFDIFAHVAARLRARRPDIQFLVIGDDKTIYGNEQPYIGGRNFKDFVLQQSGLPPSAVHWRPFMPYDAFRQHLYSMDVAVLPVFEGAANWSVFEGMAAGVPMLTSSKAFVSEAIETGKDGILLHPYDINGFVEHTLALLDDPARAKRMGDAARERIMSDFSVGEAARGYAAVIHRAIDAHKSARRTDGWEMTNAPPGYAHKLAV